MTTTVSHEHEEQRIGAYRVRATSANPFVGVEIRRDFDDSPILAALYLSPDDVRQLIAVLAVALKPEPSSSVQATKVKALSEKIRAKFADPIEPITKFDYAKEARAGHRTICPFPITGKIAAYIGPEEVA